MRRVLKSLWRGVQYVADCVVLLACWALWIALGVLLAAQAGIMFSREFAVPAFVLRSIEERFTASHVNARFGRAIFDPTGGVLLENVSFSLPEFSEPVVRARAVFVELDPWLLFAGRLEARRVRGTGITLSIPAMLAPSGRNEETLRDLEFAVSPKSGQLLVEQLTGRIAGVAVMASGAVQLPSARATGEVRPLPLIEAMAENYAVLCRQLIRAQSALTAFEQPELHVTLSPTPGLGASALLNITAASATLPKVEGISVRDLSATVSVPLFHTEPATSPLLFTAGEIRAADGAVVHRLFARVNGVMDPAKFTYTPKEIDLTTPDVAMRGFSLEAVSSHLTAREQNVWDASVISRCAGLLLSADGRVNLAETTARMQIEGALSPDLLTPISAQIGHDVRRFVDFAEPMDVKLDVTFTHGWKFEKVGGHISVRKINAYHVPIDAADGEIEFDGRHFLAHDAVARLGENQAHGSFEQDLKTLQFRFLLEGRLRPLDIHGWFGEWWPDFFQHFQFPAAPPAASVDVQGRWFAGRETTVFVFAESISPTIRGTALDYGRTLMFIRPDFFDALEFFATRGAGDVKGRFVRWLDLDAENWKEMTFSLDSTLDLSTGGGLLGPEFASKLEPFTFAQAPHVKASGRFDGPAAPGGEHQSMEIEARSTGDFSLYKFPAHNLSFDATLRDDVLTLEHINVQVASGTLTGRARLSGPDSLRKLGFDGALRDAHLAEAVAAVSNYAAERRGQPRTDPDKFLSGKSQIKLDLALSAEGRFDDLLSYQGNGNAVLNGPELGEVRLLGLLSDLLDFTALRFTTARLNFQVQGRKVTFPNLSVTGANSAIEGHGDYWLDRGEINFNARVYPFQESKSLLQNVVGAVLLPLSTALEVKLTGPLTQPKWSFVIGPTNFFRNLTQPAKVDAEPSVPTEASPYLKR
jgi:hypothetical protein